MDVSMTGNRGYIQSRTSLGQETVFMESPHRMYHIIALTGAAHAVVTEQKDLAWTMMPAKALFKPQQYNTKSAIPPYGNLVRLLRINAAPS